MACNTIETNATMRALCVKQVTSLPLYATIAFFGILAAACSAPDSLSGSQESPISTVRFVESHDPVPDAAITPLFGALNEDDTITTLAVDPNNEATVSDSSGAFQLAISESSAVTGLQVTVEVPSESGPAIGRLDWRTTVDQGAESVELEIPRPRACTGTDCGTPLLPDLTPIIAWEDLSAEAVERLEPGTTFGPPTAGLFPAETWFVSEEDDRRLLRFATVAANLGDGPLDIIAGPDDGDRSPTWQRVWTDTLTFEDHLSGEFIFHPTHDHVHFDAFERYRLLNADGEVVASSEKVSFCLRDSVRIADQIPDPTGPMLSDDGSCEGQQQVINAGFGDHYHALLDDQWIDITGVPAGNYVVEIAVDPFNLIIESDETNNVGSFPIALEP